jgi:tripartite-type tricarboxylate transporter receptor subunit TctC
MKMGAASKTTRRTVLAMAASSAAWPVFAQTLPQGPIRIVAGFAAGGSSDAMARLIADKLEALLGRRIIVENKPGAGGRLAAEEVKRAPADGSVVLLANTSMMVLAPLAFVDIRYDAVEDFAPIARLADFQVALATGKLTGAASMPALLSWLKANPSQANYGVPAAGSLPHLTALALEKEAGIPMQVVVFQGGAPIAQAMAGGHLAMGLGASADYAEQHRGKLVNLVAMTGTVRHPALPDVPTFQELGFKGMIDTAWSGLFLPRSSSTAIIEIYRAAVEATLAMPDVRTKLEALGFLVTYGAPDAVTALIRQDQARWQPVVEAAGLRK